MSWAKCRKKCFDGNAGRLYYEGDMVEDMPPDHPFIKNGCFKYVPEVKKATPPPEEPEEVEEPKKEDAGDKALRKMGVKK